MSNRLVKVAGYDNLSRDTSTGVIVNTNNAARQAYRARKARLQAEQERIKTLEAEVGSLKQSMTDMNTKMDMMLQLLMAKKDN